MDTSTGLVAIDTTPEVESAFFEREELMALRERCWALSEMGVIDRDWQRALLSLADAADRLDAMIARTVMSVNTSFEFDGSDAE